MRALLERLNWALTLCFLDACEAFDRWASERRARSLRACAKFPSLPLSRL